MKIYFGKETPAGDLIIFRHYNKGLVVFNTSQITRYLCDIRHDLTLLKHLKTATQDTTLHCEYFPYSM